MSSIINESGMSSSSNSTYIENVVKERCANLILTGKRANEGNHKIWRSYAEGTARALNLKHIVSQMDRVKNSMADQSEPLNLLSSDDEEDQILMKIHVRLIKMVTVVTKPNSLLLGVANSC